MKIEISDEMIADLCNACKLIKPNSPEETRGFEYLKKVTDYLVYQKRRTKGKEMLAKIGEKIVLLEEKALHNNSYSITQEIRNLVKQYEEVEAEYPETKGR